MISKIIMLLISEGILKDLILLGLRKLAESTESKVDDEIVKAVEDALSK